MKDGKDEAGPTDGAQLRASELRYRRLFETAQDGILILDFDTGVIIDANPFITSLMGYSREELLGKQLWELGVFENIASAKTAFDELKGTGYARFENMPLMTRDGRTKEVEFVSNSYRNNGSFVIQCNIRDITERANLQKQTLRDSHTDFLTGAENRRHFQELLKGESKRSNRYNHPLSLLMLDIDHFKGINDTYGHAAGDKVLQAFADECVTQLRDFDIVARIGGEEFCAILPETGEEKAIETAQRLCLAIAALRVSISEDQSIRITVSIGVATTPGRGEESIEDLLARADARLYAAKHDGRNCVRPEPSSP